jgi:hypothetical protein
MPDSTGQVTPFITEADIERHLGWNKKKPETEPDVPTIHFHVPKLTTEQIVNSVQSGKPVWRTLQALHEESIEERRSKRLSDQFDLTPIPEPYFESEDL